MHEDTGADAEVKEFTSLDCGLGAGVDSGSSSEAVMGAQRAGTRGNACDSHSAWAATHTWGSSPKLWVCPSP